MIHRANHDETERSFITVGYQTFSGAWAIMYVIVHALKLDHMVHSVNQYFRVLCIVVEVVKILEVGND